MNGTGPHDEPINLNLKTQGKQINWKKLKTKNQHNRTNRISESANHSPHSDTKTLQLRLKTEKLTVLNTPIQTVQSEAMADNAKISKEFVTNSEHS